MGFAQSRATTDRAATGDLDTGRFGSTARSAVEWTRARLRPENREFLRGLPRHLLIDGRFFAVHAALHPEPNDELHLSNDARVEASFRQLETGRFASRLCFFGHTHRPVIYEHGRGTRRVEGASVTLLPDACYLVNPGSVGQPRGHDLRAGFAVFDALRGAIELRLVAYDWQSARARSNRAGLLREEPALARAMGRVMAQVDRSRDALRAKLGR